MFNIINQTRAQHNLPAYSLSSVQSNGTGPCVGSYGHSVAMAKSGTIWHIAPNDNPSGPQNPASFPNDLCVSHSAGGENVGAFASGNELTDLQSMHQEMMSEGYAPGCSGSHACNILSSQYVEVGIGIYESGGETWLTEDFIRP